MKTAKIWRFPACPLPADGGLDWEQILRCHPWLDEMRGVPQDPRYHAEGDVLEHTRLVVDVDGRRPDGNPVANVYGYPGRVVLVGEKPLLEAVMDTNGAPLLILYAASDTTNLIQGKPVLEGNTNTWQTAFEVEIPAANLWQTIRLTPTNQTMFYRAVRR